MYGPSIIIIIYTRQLIPAKHVARNVFSNNTLPEYTATLYVLEVSRLVCDGLDSTTETY